MGYTTDFRGSFQLDKPLQPKILAFLKLFNETRRMGRNTDPAFGIEGEFFVFGSGSFGQDKNSDIRDYNQSPSTQPGLWCQWTPSEDGTEIKWDEGEKFYNYTEWLVYIIEKIIKPNGYVLNGSVDWRGEDFDDSGTLTVSNNVVYENGTRIDPIEKIRTDVVLILVEDGCELKENTILLLPVSTEKDHTRLKTALDNFEKAFKELSNAWGDNPIESMCYPFEKSFDDYDVAEWVDDFKSLLDSE